MGYFMLAWRFVQNPCIGAKIFQNIGETSKKVLLVYENYTYPDTTPSTPATILTRAFFIPTNFPKNTPNWHEVSRSEPLHLKTIDYL